MDASPYLEGVKSLLSIASNFEDLEFVDLGEVWYPIENKKMKPVLIYQN